MRCILSVLSILVFTNSSIIGQTVRGRVLDASSRASVATASIHLIGPDSLRAASIIANDSGAFTIRAPKTGTYAVHIERIGYAAQITPASYLSEGQTYHLEIALKPSAIAVAPVTIKVEPRVRALEQVGYYTRKRVGLGRFIDRSTIEKRFGATPSEIFRTVPSLVLREKRYGRGSYVYFRGGSGICAAKVYVEGMPQNRGNEPFDFESLQLLDIEAFEIYRPSQVPAQYTSADSACGVILVWLRR